MEQTYRVLTHEIMNTIALLFLYLKHFIAPGTDEKVIRGLGVIREQSEKTDGIHRIISDAYRICAEPKRSDSH